MNLNTKVLKKNCNLIAFEIKYPLLWCFYLNLSELSVNKDREMNGLEGINVISLQVGSELTVWVTWCT